MSKDIIKALEYAVGHVVFKRYGQAVSALSDSIRWLLERVVALEARQQHQPDAEVLESIVVGKFALSKLDVSDQMRQALKSVLTARLSETPHTDTVAELVKAVVLLAVQKQDKVFVCNVSTSNDS